MAYHGLLWPNHGLLYYDLIMDYYGLLWPTYGLIMAYYGYGLLMVMA